MAERADAPHLSHAHVEKAREAIDFLSSLAPAGDQPSGSRASSTGIASVSTPVRKSKYGQKDIPGETKNFWKSNLGVIYPMGGGGTDIKWDSPL